jgi:hypothetical protein
VQATPIQFWTSNLERMRIDSAGNLIVGTTASNTKFKVYLNSAGVGNSSSAQFVQDGSGDAAISFLIGATTEWLAGVDNSDGDKFKITNSTGGSDFTTKGIIIDTVGNIGVGTASPANISGGGDLTVAGRYLNGTTGASYPAYSFSTDAQSGMFLASSSNLGFAIANTERMRIDSSGNLLLGTTSLNRLGSGASGTSFQLNATGGAEIYLSAPTVTSGEFIGAVNFGTTGTSSGTKRSALIGSVLTAASGTNVSGNLIFYTNNAGTLAERMSISAAGNVGIGALAPVSRLEVVNSGVAALIIGYNNTSENYYDANTQIFRNAAATERMRIDSNGNVCVGTATALATSDNRGNVTINGTNGSILAMGVGGTTKGYLFQDSSTMYLVNAGSGSTNFEVNGSERMRINSSGQLIVGNSNTTNNARLEVYQASANWAFGIRNAANDSGIYITNGSGTAGYTAMGFYNNGASFSFCGAITPSGTGTTYSTSSDYRLKENISPMTGALAKIALLKPVTYKWKTDGSNGQGFIAHELAEVVPDCVIGEKDGLDKDGKPQYQGVDTSFLVATLTAAIQEQQALITSLTARIAALESK